VFALTKRLLEPARRLSGPTSHLPEPQDWRSRLANHAPESPQGTFPDVLSKVVLSRSDAIAVDGYVGAEVNGTGPQ